MKKNICGYYFITDESLSRNGMVADVRAAVNAGCTLVQYRAKDKTTRELLSEAQRVVAACRERHARAIINDRVDIALASGADGVHLGQDDLPCLHARRLLGTGAIIGVTVHSEDEARRAIDDGASYLAVSPIYATSTKPDAGAPAGIELIRRVRALTTVPIVAIGGITLERVPEVMRAGADAICAISAVLNAPSISEEVRRFIAAAAPFATGDCDPS